MDFTNYILRIYWTIIAWLCTIIQFNFQGRSKLHKNSEIHCPQNFPAIIIAYIAK